MPLSRCASPCTQDDGDPKYFTPSTQRMVNIFSALMMFLIGLLISYAPQYIQANIPWLTTGTQIMSLLCFAASIKVFIDTYPHLLTRENIMLAVCLPSVQSRPKLTGMRY
jgi:O-antigen ligase